MSCLSLLVAMSLHVGLAGDYNGIHPHARCTIDNTIAGVYYNSESNIGVYIGQKFEMPFDSELEVGLVTGYTGEKVVPMMRITRNNWYFAPSYEVEPNNNWGVTIGYEFKLY